ncbi:unnamed protein product [Mytilus coruscus]|uniref:EGF-like domain-containing protein n=1 Tax=Mytilus coruscus TaxID=42192 RepID=A0A6J8E438_MYTCO|nr:unnamed protein product [Mytilus coruscus]
MYSLMIVTVTCSLQISKTLSPTSKNVCPEKWPSINDEFRNISRDAFGVKCCPNFLEIDGICEPCPAGTYGKSCINQCVPGYYGMGCKAKCNCSSFQECHNIFGCVCKAGYTGDNCDQDITSADSTVTFMIATSIPREAIIIEVATIKVSGSSNKDWILYTLCIAGVIVLTALTHLLRSYRQRKSSKVRFKSEEVVLESTTTSPYTGAYDEIDENVITDNTPGVCLIATSSKMEVVYFVPQESMSITTITKHVDTDYLDRVFEAEDERGTSDEQIDNKDGISTCSFESDAIVPNSTENVSPSNFKENRHEHLHGYTVPVMVHQCFESSSGTDEDATHNKNSHMYKSLQKDSQMTSNEYEQLETLESNKVHDATLQAVTQFIYGTSEYPNCINKYAGADKTINSCDGIKIRKDNSSDHNKPTTGDKKHKDAFEYKESPGNYNLNNAICSQVDDNIYSNNHANPCYYKM